MIFFTYSSIYPVARFYRNYYFEDKDVGANMNDKAKQDNNKVEQDNNKAEQDRELKHKELENISGGVRFIPPSRPSPPVR